MRDPVTLLPSKSVLGRAVRLPLRLLPRGRAMPILSGTLRGGRWVVGAGVHSCWLGTYELEKQHQFVGHVRQGGVVYDIGAHAGFYTLLSSRLVGPAGMVFAFEPSPLNLPHLRRHVELNRCANVRVLDCAISDEAGEMGFDLAGSYQGRISEGGSVKVRVRTIDELIASGEVRPAQLVKIDVEGAELKVLKGGEQFFRKHHPTLFLATHGEQVHAECCELLSGWGFVVSPLGKGTDLKHTDELLVEWPAPAGTSA